jgi:hypothetical protein
MTAFEVLLALLRKKELALGVWRLRASPERRSKDKAISTAQARGSIALRSSQLN